MNKLVQSVENLNFFASLDELVQLHAKVLWVSAWEIARVAGLNLKMFHFIAIGIFLHFHSFFLFSWTIFFVYGIFISSALAQHDPRSNMIMACYLHLLPTRLWDAAEPPCLRD